MKLGFFQTSPAGNRSSLGRSARLSPVHLPRFDGSVYFVPVSLSLAFLRHVYFSIRLFVDGKRCLIDIADMHWRRDEASRTMLHFVVRPAVRSVLREHNRQSLWCLLRTEISAVPHGDPSFTKLRPESVAYQSLRNSTRPLRRVQSFYRIVDGEVIGIWVIVGRGSRSELTPGGWVGTGYQPRALEARVRAKFCDREGGSGFADYEPALFFPSDTVRTDAADISGSRKAQNTYNLSLATRSGARFAMWEITVVTGDQGMFDCSLAKSCKVGP